MEVTPQPNEMTLVLPNELVGESGDEFSPEFQALLYGFARLGFWPQDFGEGDNTHVTLFFVKAGAGIPDAVTMTKNFIDCGGDV